MSNDDNNEDRDTPAHDRGIETGAGNEGHQDHGGSADTPAAGSSDAEPAARGADLAAQPPGGAAKPVRQKNGRFAKGHSGNSRGRPPKLPHGPFLSQHRRDIIEIMQEEITANTPKGRIKIPIQTAILRSLTGRALKGDLRAIQVATTWYHTALKELYGINHKLPLADPYLEILTDETNELGAEAIAAMSAELEKLRKLR
ncbi:DUF5681 domain-containing protein [Tabrizicola soli]|uniref:DUF5681 domain-containing protein n=1 Tax=Tabrizicola soli TaxID=2185115 RepID=A0ABV7DZZ0_9RHOB|nr:DUF5681 domain-containing protein [Tabrizicola soli]